MLFILQVSILSEQTPYITCTTDTDRLTTLYRRRVPHQRTGQAVTPMYYQTGTHLGHTLQPVRPKGMSKSCSPSGKALPVKSLDHTPVTSGSKDGPDTSRGETGNTTHTASTATPTADCNLSPKIYSYHIGECVQPGGTRVHDSPSMCSPTTMCGTVAITQGLQLPQMGVSTTRRPQGA